MLPAERSDLPALPRSARPTCVARFDLVSNRRGETPPPILLITLHEAPQTWPISSLAVPGKFVTPLSSHDSPKPSPCPPPALSAHLGEIRRVSWRTSSL